MFMKGAFMFFASLGLGYVLCVLAKKQEGLLKTVGYTLGIAMLVMTLIYGLLASQVAECFMGKGFGKCHKMWKAGCPLVKHQK